MTTRQINTILWTAAGITGVAALIALIAFAALPIRSSALSHPDPTSHLSGPRVAPAGLPAIESFEPIASRPLRPPLNDAVAAAPAPTMAPASAAAVAPQLALVGTIGTSLAMIKTADGTVSLRSVGEQIAGADVLAIRPTQVDLRIAGRTVTLEKPAELIDNP